MAEVGTAGNGKRISVIVADHTAMGSQLIASVLRNCEFSFEVATEKGCVKSLVERLCHSPADVALIHANLDEGPGSGIAAVRAVQQYRPESKLVVLLDRCDREAVLEAVRARASGVFTGDTPVEWLGKCVYTVHKGERWLSSRDVGFLLEEIASVQYCKKVVGSHGRELLTEREHQVMVLVMEALTNREIADRLRLSEHTVKNYLFRIFDKLGVSNRVELVLYARSGSGLAA